jgi:hypothetical protein
MFHKIFNATSRNTEFSLSALTIIHQLMMNDSSNDVKSIFLQNGILEWILLDFDVGFDSEENSVFLDGSWSSLCFKGHAKLFEMR